MTGPGGSRSAWAGLAAKRGGGGERRGVAKLWARRKIAALMDQRTAGAPEAIGPRRGDRRRPGPPPGVEVHQPGGGRSHAHPPGRRAPPDAAAAGQPAGRLGRRGRSSAPCRRTATPARLLLLLGLAALGAGWLLLGAPHAARGASACRGRPGGRRERRDAEPPRSWSSGGSATAGPVLAADGRPPPRAPGHSPGWPCSPSAPGRSPGAPGSRPRPPSVSSSWSGPGSARWPATGTPGPGRGRTPGRWPG